MKIFRLIGIVLLAIVLCVNLASCSSDDDEKNECQTPKEYIVSLSFKGDMIDIVESPLTRTQSSDLYYIRTTIEKEDGYVPYAYGLFDDTSAMNIKLTSDKKYKFFAFLIRNGKEKIQHTNTTYSAPFNCDLNNMFIYEKPHTSFNNNTFTLLDGENYKIANVDFYVAANEVEYTPVKDGNVTIFMLRQSFGAKFVAENLTEGSLKITLSNNETSLGQFNSPTISIDYPNTTIEDIFVLQPFSSDGDGDLCAHLNVSFVWVKEDDTKIELGAPTITFRRNKLTTITLKVDKSMENGIDFSYDSTEYGDGGSYIVNGNDVSEIVK